MFSLSGKLTFINIDQDYLKYLHGHCAEVYYKPIGYENKPYLGILISKENQQYVIPLSSAKEKHKLWKNIEADRFLIYEKCNQKPLSKNAVCKEMPNGTIEHLLSVIDLKKMIPIKEGLYTKVDLTANESDSEELRNYKNLMNKEYSFCLKILDSIIQKASRLYDKQMKTGKIVKFCCDFRLLEKKCSEWESPVLFDEMKEKMSLPYTKLCETFPKKALEKFRIYIIALILIQKGEYPYIYSFVPQKFLLEEK